MTEPSRPTLLERVSGSRVAELGLTYIAALSATPWAALLPPLAKSLASERQRVRVESALVNVLETLETHQAELQRIGDAQYKLINESILALLQTTDTAKIELLRSVVKNSLSAMGILDHDAVALSRIIRDISADEARFVMTHYTNERIWLTISGDGDQRAHIVDPSSSDAGIVSGLISLGLLFSAASEYAGLGMYGWSPLVPRLVALLSNTAA